MASTTRKSVNNGNQNRGAENCCWLPGTHVLQKTKQIAKLETTLGVLFVILQQLCKGFALAFQKL